MRYPEPGDSLSMLIDLHFHSSGRQQMCRMDAPGVIRQARKSGPEIIMTPDTRIHMPVYGVEPESADMHPLKKHTHKYFSYYSGGIP